MTRHTKGPWIVDYIDTGEEPIAIISADDGLRALCEIHSANNHDARLVAAAPEMYEALKEPARRLRHCADNIRDEFPLWASDLEKMADQFAAALSKAEGKS